METSFKTSLKTFSWARQPSSRYLEGCPSVGLYNGKKIMFIRCVTPEILQEKQKKPWKKFLPWVALYKKKGVIYWSLLHSQRWCVRDIWYFLTTLQLVCFRMRYDYHFYHRHRFRKKQQITIFFLLCWNNYTTSEIFSSSMLARETLFHFVREKLELRQSFTQKVLLGPKNER